MNPMRTNESGYLAPVFTGNPFAWTEALADGVAVLAGPVGFDPAPWIDTSDALRARQADPRVAALLAEHDLIEGDE